MVVLVPRPTSDARAASARIVAEVIGSTHYLDRVFEQTLARHEALRLEASLIQEMCYGTMRWFHQLDGIARALLQRPLRARDSDIRALLLLGLYQLRYMNVPPHAAVSQTVEATEALGKPWAKNVLNACLRGYLRRQESLEQLVAGDPVLASSHPAWLLERIQAAYPDVWRSIVAVNNSRPPLVLRVNLRRTTRDAYVTQLRAAGIDAAAVTIPDSDLSPDAAIFVARPVPTAELPGFGHGAVSVQDVAAQLAALLLDVTTGARILDACAAPGGKTAHILELGRDIRELVALDAQPRRAQLMTDDLARLRCAASVRVADAADPRSWWDGEAFDRILADVPCSATGVIRRHPDIKVRRRPDDIPRLVTAQAQLLDGLWPTLRRGGKLLYATCSVLPDENERQIGAFLARHGNAVDVRLPRLPGVRRRFGHQLRPGDGAGAGTYPGLDGFYYACLQKT